MPGHVGQKRLGEQAGSRTAAKRDRESLAFRRANLLPALYSDEKKVCDNFLNPMRKLGAIGPDPEGGPGAYRFSNQLHALYFYIEAQRAKEQTHA